jgi:hypothetical protein
LSIDTKEGTITAPNAKIVTCATDDYLYGMYYNIDKKQGVIVRRFFCIVIFLCLNIGLLFSQEWRGTYLGRICEFDTANVKGLMDTGKFIIISEQISYSLGENGVDVSYRYRIKKLTQTGNNTFGLSLRNRGMEGRGDVPVNTLNVLVNGSRTQVSHIETERNYYGQLYDDNGNIMEIDWDNEWEDYMSEVFTNAYRGWYYFNVDFPISGEADIEISYRTILDDTGIRYNSYPFWLPVKNDAEIKVSIENNLNESFIRTIIGCEPRNSLITENWKLEKSRQNRIVITYTPTWFTENFSQKKIVSIIFDPLYPAWTMPSSNFFHIVSRAPESAYHHYGNDGVYLGSESTGYGRRADNISRRVLGTYELIFLNSWQLRLIRNAFYALHGYRFRDSELNELLYESGINIYRYDIYNYHIHDNWYNENFTEDVISPIERRNIEIIQNLENMLY